MSPTGVDIDPSSSPLAPAGVAVERQVATEMVRRGAPALPVLVVLAGLVWGLDGAASAALACALVVTNLFVAAGLVSWAARRSLALLAAAAFGGFFVRLAILFVAVLAVRDLPWVHMVALGVTLAVTHAVLLVWEARHVSFSLAFPGVKPRTARG